MDTIYLLSQIMAGLGLTFALISAMMKTKKLMLTFMICGSLSNIASYALIQSVMSVIVCAFVLARSISYFILTQKEKPFKYYLLPMCLVLIGFYCVFPFIYKVPIDLIVICTTTLCTIVLAFRNLLAIRISLCISCALWVVYDLYLVSYVMVVSDVAHIVAYLVAIIIFNIIPYIRAKKTEKSLEQQEVVNETDKKQQKLTRQSVRVKNTITKQ